jgi:hypothetical protein
MVVQVATVVPVDTDVAQPLMAIRQNPAALVLRAGRQRVYTALPTGPRPIVPLLGYFIVLAS